LVVTTVALGAALGAAGAAGALDSNGARGVVTDGIHWE
jgi:hypothetical protein